MWFQAKITQNVNTRPYYICLCFTHDQYMRRNYQPKQKFDSLTRLRQEFYCFLIVAWCVYVVLLNQNPCRVFFANVNTIEFVYGSNRIQKSSISNRGCQDETEFYMKKCTVSKSKVWMERDIDRICIPWNQYRRQFLRNSTIWNRTLDFVKIVYTHIYTEVLTTI